MLSIEDNTCECVEYLCNGFVKDIVQPVQLQDGSKLKKLANGKLQSRLRNAKLLTQMLSRFYIHPSRSRCHICVMTSYSTTKCCGKACSSDIATNYHCCVIVCARSGEASGEGEKGRDGGEDCVPILCTGSLQQRQHLSLPGEVVTAFAFCDCYHKM